MDRRLLLVGVCVACILAVLNSPGTPYLELGSSEQQSLTGGAYEECDAFVSAPCGACVAPAGCAPWGIWIFTHCKAGVAGTDGCTGATHEPCVSRYAAPGCTACTCGTKNVPSCPAMTPAGACPAGVCVVQTTPCDCQC